MTKGNSSFMGRGMSLEGNSEMVSETAGTDILTITSATAQTGNSLVIDGISSSTANAIKINVSSTGAMAASAAENANAVLVQASSKSVLNCVVFYDSEPSGATAASVSTAVAFLGSAGTKAPTYFLTMGGTGGPGEGAATTNGYFTAGLTQNTAATKAAVGGIKCLFGSKAYYILAVPDSNLG